MELPPVARWFVRALVRSTLVLVLLGVPLALVWARVAGIGFGMPERIAAALSSDAIEVAVGRLAFDLREGLVAENLALIERASGHRLASVNRLALSLNIAALAAQEVQVESLSLAGASAAIPLAGSPGSELQVSDISGEVAVTGETLQLRDIRATVLGVRIEVGGQLDSPQGGRVGRRSAAPGPPSNATTGISWPARVVEALGALRFGTPRPVVALTLSGDLGDPGSIAADPITVRTGRVAGKGWELAALDVAGAWRRDAIRVDRMVVHDADGYARVWAAMSGGRIEIEGYSSLNPASFAAALSEDFAQAEFPGAAHIAFRATGRTDALRETLTVTGRLEAAEATYRDMAFREVSSDFAWRSGTLFLSDARAAGGGGDIRGDVLAAPGDFRARFSSSIPPSLIAPLLSAKDRATLSLMEFRDRPIITVELRGQEPRFEKLHGNGTLALGETAMRDVWIDHARARLGFGNGAVTYHDFEIARDGQPATGTFVYDFRNQLVRLDNVVSRLKPVDVLMWVDPRIADSVRPYRFRGAPLVKASGVVFMKDPSRNDLSISVDAAEGLDYDLLGRTLRFGRTTAAVTLDGSDLDVRVQRARLMGGEVRVDAGVSLDPARPTLEVEASGNGVRFADLTKLYFDYEGSEGIASGRYRFEAELGREAAMRGSGSVRVEDGNVFAIPLLGPLSEIIHKIIPGTGYETARLATADFTIANRKVQTNNLEIEGTGFSLLGEGSVGFPEGGMDMAVRINARGLPGIVLFPVSKLFEYVSTGTFGDPAWRPKIIPRLPGQRATRAGE